MKGSLRPAGFVPGEQTEPAVLAFAADIEAAIVASSQKLNDNQVITVLTAALDRAFADACEPAEGPTRVRARLAHVIQSLEEQAAARLDPAMPRLTAEVVDGLRSYAEASYCSSDRADRVEAHGLFMLCDWQDAARAPKTTAANAVGMKPLQAAECNKENTKEMGHE